MTEETLKCVKGESCIHCGSTYCRFVDEVNELEQENKELKELNKKICEDWEKEIKVYWNALEEIKAISDNYNLTVNERKKQIADKINEVLE